MGCRARIAASSVLGNGKLIPFAPQESNKPVCRAEALRRFILPASRRISPIVVYRFRRQALMLAGRARRMSTNWPLIAGGAIALVALIWASVMFGYEAMPPSGGVGVTLFDGGLPRSALSPLVTNGTACKPHDVNARPGCARGRQGQVDPVAGCQKREDLGAIQYRWEPPATTCSEDV